MQNPKPSLPKVRKSKAFYEYMTPGFWRAHYMVPGTIALLAIGMALGIAHNSSFRPHAAQAALSDNIRGWAWSTNVGWISLNNLKPNCSSPPSATCEIVPGGGVYGINLASTATLQADGQQGQSVNGFVWSDNLGFICFGSSCNIPACRGASATTFYAYTEPITDSSPKEVHGWALICGLKDTGWISLNCKDTGSCTGGNTVYYKLVYNPADYKFHSVAVTGSPFGYNGNTDGSGIGYIKFYPTTDGMYLNVPQENTDPLCSDGLDNDFNGLKDCADPNCASRAICTTSELNWFGPALTQQYLACHDTLDNNFNGKIDCSGVGASPADPSCVGSAVCTPEWNFTNGCTNGTDDDGDTKIDCADTDCSTRPECTTEFSCVDNVDNDGNGLKDCADPGCLLDPACTPPQPQCVDNAACAAIADPAAHANCCCGDNSLNGQVQVDCIDPLCQAQAPVCSAWTKALGGNIYAGGGITGTQAPAQAGVPNAAFCLRANASIEWTSPSSYAACRETSAGSIPLPTQENKYRSTLGFLDLAGLRGGRYGTVVTVSDASQIAPTGGLNGQVYRYAQSGTTFDLPAKTFLNGLGTTGNGAGTLLIEGANLNITGDIAYTSDPVQQRLKNLASFGVIVVKDSAGAGGDVTINSAVTKVSGAIFAEGTIHTGTGGNYLKLLGLYIAYKFDLQRANNTDPTKPAEEFIFDGRAVVNPPPGMQDASKSLPRTTDASF